MKNKLLVAGIVLLFSSSLYAQSEKLAETSLSNNVTKYVIGIGNEDEKLYNEVLNDLQTNSTLKVFAYCEKNKLLGLAINNNHFINGYDSLRDLLLSNYPGIELYRKTENSLNLDCNDQILKQ